MAEVTNNPEEAARLVAGGTPVVLVGPDALALGRFAASTAGGAGEGLLAVLVGDLADPEVLAAASEMAAELWPWSGSRPPRPPCSPRSQRPPRSPSPPRSPRPN